jgi:hypothetical protein
MRGIVLRREVAMAAAAHSSAVLASALGLRTRVAVRDLPEDEGAGVAFDLAAGRHRPRGAHAPHAVGVVAVGDPALLARGNVLARLAHSGVFALASPRRAADAVWAEVPPWAKAVVFDRGARVVGWSPAEAGVEVGGRTRTDDWIAAAAFVGIAAAMAMRGRTPESGARELDGVGVEREVAEALRTMADRAGSADSRGTGPDAELAQRGGRAARVVFEALIEVPRATIERDDDGVRLGRHARSPR